MAALKSSVFAAILLWSYVIGAVGAVGAQGAQETKRGESRNPQKGPGKDEPIMITSDRMEVDQKKNIIRYTGNVVAVRGDLTLKSDSLTVIYDPSAQRIDQVIATGNLVVTQGDRVATGKQAVFSGAANTITLTGKPSLRQANSRVSGARIILHLNENRGVVEGGEERVSAVIFPSQLGVKDLGEEQ